MEFNLAKEHHLRLEGENVDLRTAVDKMDDIIAELKQELAAIEESRRFHNGLDRAERMQREFMESDDT